MEEPGHEALEDSCNQLRRMYEHIEVKPNCRFVIPFAAVTGQWGLTRSMRRFFTSMVDTLVDLFVQSFFSNV